MTVDTQQPAVAGAVETSDRVASHLHPVGSRNIDDHPVPSGREEPWRFTPLKRLRGLHDSAPFGPGACTVEVSAPDGITVREVGSDDPVRGSSGYLPTDRVTARVWNAVPGATVIEIGDEVEVDEPAVITFTGTAAELAGAGHLVISAGKFAKGTVVLRFTGEATVADLVEIIAGEGSQLTVVSVQDWADSSVHHSAQHASIGRDASLRHIAISFGGLVRLSASVEYAAPGGEAELLGVYFADAGQHLEHRLFVDHNQPKTISNVSYKGALQGQDAHAVWIGDVLIRKVAEGIETYEENRNLILTTGAQADSVPNLEIETGEIEGAGHASTTGRFDDEQLFYLRSRGIPEEEARRLVVHAFFAEIINRIGVPDVESELLAAVEAELEAHLNSPASQSSATETPVEA